MLAALAFLAISAVYASVGQAGGTGFLAVMAVAGIPVDQLRPTALAMNIVAASYTTWRLHALGLIDWHRLLALAAPALPAAFIGGLIALPAGLYVAVTGVLLVASAVLMVMRPQAARWSATASTAGSLALGATAGLLSGLSGIGGGVFVAPALIVLGWARPKEAAGLSARALHPGQLDHGPSRAPSCRASISRRSSRSMPPLPFWAQPSAPCSRSVSPSESSKS